MLFSWIKQWRIGFISLVCGVIVVAALSLRLILHPPAFLYGAAGMFDDQVRAPDFPPDFKWLNTPEPLSFKHQLKGQVVLLDFWTYGCINCMHIIPDLDYLQDHFKGQPFVIIGVHSAKFTNESTLANIRQAVLRYKIQHPIVVDQNMKIWDSYGVNSWPTLVLVDARGRIVGAVSGEGNRDSLEKVIAKTLLTDRLHGWLAKEPLVLPPEAAMQSASGLSFPGKVLADAQGKRLFISDSDHNRIVIASWPNDHAMATLEAVIGCGKAGRRDGPAATAEFNGPQGLALEGHNLYVADTLNHLIRKVNLKTMQVTTILGTGREVYDVTGGGTGTAQGINSPWDLAVRAQTLYIAMAGEHQIWKMNLKTLKAQPLAGSGGEGLQNGYGPDAALAQPSGLALDGNTLYFADSENSAVRGVNLTDDNVFTVVGHGLFDFGDEDGNRDVALLQHDLGVAVFHDKLLVADTYNHKLRLINPKTGNVSTFAGTGQPGVGVPGGAVQFYEPGGLSVSGNTIFVADTDNQRIVMINGRTKAWHELVIAGLHSPVTSQQPAAGDSETPATALLKLALNDGKPIIINADLHIPTDAHLTPGVPVSLRITNGSSVLLQQTLEAGKTHQVTFTLNPKTLPKSALVTDDVWTFDIYYSYCTNGLASVCRPAQARWQAHVAFASSGSNAINLPQQ